MALATRYRCEFKDDAGLLWQWDFQWEAWGGSITAMQAAGDPAEFDLLSDSDDLYEAPVRGTKATLRIIATALSQYAIFSTILPQQIFCIVTQGGNTYFKGWVEPNSYEEAYDDYPFVVSISVTDGLGYLKELDYVPTTEGRISEDNIIINDILSKIGFTAFNEVVNIYEENMSATTNDSPLDQVYVHTDAFEDLTCYEVLEKILSKWKALIRQYNGIMHIYRPKEMNGISYMRKFTAPATKTLETVNWTHQISRTATPSDFRDTNGGRLMHLTTAKQLSLRHDWGIRESWIKNWEFKAETFDGTDFEEWTQINGTYAKPVSDYVTDEKEGVIITGFAGLVTLYSLRQTFGTNARISIDDMLSLEFDWGALIPTGETAGAGKNVELIIRQGSMYLSEVNATKMYWSPYWSKITIPIPSATTGWSGWTTYRRQIDPSGFCMDGEITIDLLSELASLGDIYSCFRRLRFFVSSYETMARETSYKGRNRLSTLSHAWNREILFKQVLKEVKEKEYLVTGATFGLKLEDNQIIGDIPITEAGMDNVLEQFKGSLGYATLTDPHNFAKVFIRNQEMDNRLAIASSTMLAISDIDGQVITVDNLPDYDKFDISGWVAMLIDEDKTTTTDPTATGDYSYKNFVTIDRAAKALTFPDGYDLTAWEVGDNLAVYNPFLNYRFVGDQTQGPIVGIVAAPTWRSQWSINGGMFRHSDGRFIWIVAGWNGTGYSIGFVSTTDFNTWTMGNSDLPVVVPGDFADCKSVHQPGSVHSLGGGDYWACITCWRVSDNKNEARIMYFDEDFGTITFSDVIYDDSFDLGSVVGGIEKIGDYYHAACYVVKTAPEDRELRMAKSADLEGPYVDYQTILAGTSGVNDGAPWSNNVDNFGIFFDGTTYYGLFGATAKWSESGFKGNREYCLLDFDEDTEVWSFSEKTAVLINPLYFHDINDTYEWCADHGGGYLAMFVEGIDVYLSLTMKGTIYQAALFKFNNIGQIQPTENWARRGVTESKNILQIAAEEHALQRTTQRQILSGYPVYDRPISGTGMHLKHIGQFLDMLNIEAGIGACLISSWTNVDYETFTASATEITSAIEGGISGTCKSDAFAITDGATYTVILNLTLNSGQLPLFIIKDLADNNISNGVTAVAGNNVIDLTITTTGSGSGVLWIINSAAANYLTGKVSLSLKPRTFALNRGSYNVKQRLWHLDLCELKS